MEIIRCKPSFRPMVWGSESWELSAYPGRESTILGGRFDGMTLSELVRLSGKELLGESTGGETFPLLVKFIDAKADLSIQVHPDNDLAREFHGDGARGKYEMWYVVRAESGARLYSGFSRKVSPEEFERRATDGTITEVLRCYEARPGDVFYLPAGRVHAICSGCYIAEIQQSSDLTYRIFDYFRPGLDGKPRELHLDKAKRAVDYRVLRDYRTDYSLRKNSRTDLVCSPYFTASLYELDQALAEDLSELDSFVSLLCLEGGGKVESDGSVMPFSAGDSLLIAAENRSLRIVPDGTCKLLSSRLNAVKR